MTVEDDSGRSKVRGRSRTSVAGVVDLGGRIKVGIVVSFVAMVAFEVLVAVKSAL